MLKQKNTVSIFFNIIFIIYAFFISLCPVFFGISSKFTLPVFIVFVVAVMLFIKFLCKTELLSESNKKENLLWFFISFAVTFCALCFVNSLIRTSPSPDTQSQYAQALSGEYNDWHPVAHTFLFFTLPMAFNKSFTFLTYYQFFWFSLANSYLIFTMRKNRCPKWLCAIELFLSVNPLINKTVLHVWKDCGMAIFCMVLISQYMNIVFSKGKWLQKKRNIFFFALALAGTTFMRHNAVLFTLPIVFSLLVILKDYRKKVISAIICFVVISGTIKIPVYRLADVEKPGARVSETVGICMVIMGAVITKEPDVLDDDIRDFLYNVSPAEVWNEQYLAGDFNAIKFDERTNVELIDELGYKDVFLYTLRCFKASPYYCLQAFLRTTGLVWNVFVSDADFLSVQYFLNLNTGKTVNLPSGIQPIADNLYLIFIRIGSIDFILIALALRLIKNKKQLKNILHILPVLCYNFGTALLLTSCFDFRFFVYSYFVFVPMAYIFLRENRITEGEKV